jgi:hypothetical protein
MDQIPSQQTSALVSRLPENYPIYLLLFSWLAFTLYACLKICKESSAFTRDLEAAELEFAERGELDEEGELSELAKAASLTKEEEMELKEVVLGEAGSSRSGSPGSLGSAGSGMGKKDVRIDAPGIRRGKMD